MVTVVTKVFDGPKGPLTPGTIVDSSAWRNEQRLLNTRFLRPATESEALELEDAPATERPARKKH